jgi:Flavin containing amine oxidoreductase
VWADGNRLGYQCSICERRRFLGSLYEQLEDKSRILLEKKVVDIKHGKDGVAVRCQDGSEFRGDLVIGADGIHSRTRVEMQRLAEEMGPKGLMDRDKSSKSLGGSMCRDQESSGDLHLNARVSTGCGYDDEVQCHPGLLQCWEIFCCFATSSIQIFQGK